MCYRKNRRALRPRTFHQSNLFVVVRHLAFAKCRHSELVKRAKNLLTCALSVHPRRSGTPAGGGHARIFPLVEGVAKGRGKMAGGRYRKLKHPVNKVASLRDAPPFPVLR
jgi:hypothetical protein